MESTRPPVAYAICALGDIPNRRGRGFSLLRRMADGSDVPWHIFVVRWDRKLHAYVNRCPHHQVNLDWEHNQFIDPNGTRLICGKHGSLFAVESGECLEGPCKGGALERVRVGVLDGDICVIGVELATDELPSADGAV